MDRKELDRAGLAYLSVVYLVWGSTYLAIRVAVREGSGFPPFTMAMTRVLLASAILLGWARLRGERVRVTRDELKLLAITGAMLWVGGNGLVNWAEMRASSGFAALMVAAMPIWGECITSIADRRFPGWRMIGSILVGFLGVGVLSWPVLRQGTTADVLSVVALLFAPLSWAAGSIWLQRRKLDLGSRSLSGWQQLMGGVSLLIITLLRGEPVPTPTREAWMAWGYLLVLGSVFSFTAYMAALRRLPYRIVMTYAYVNPVIAVFLGWLILKESVTWWTATGAVLVIAGVMGIFNNRDR